MFSIARALLSPNSSDLVIWASFLILIIVFTLGDLLKQIEKIYEVVVKQTKQTKTPILEA